MRSSPPVRLPCATVHSHLGEHWLPHTIFYWDKHLHPLTSFCLQGLPLWKNSHLLLLLPHQCPNSLQCPWVEPPQWLCWGDLSSPKKQETPPWFKLLKPGHAEAFLRDSNIVVKARLHFFSKHSYNFNQDGNHDLSRIFKKLAVSASLLGTNIHEIEASWTGPEELKQANYTLWSLPKGLKFLRVVPTSEQNLPKSWG